MRRHVILALLVAVLPGCRKAAPPPPASAPSTAPAIISGSLLERVDVPNYSYLRIQQTDGKEVWAAVPTSTIAKGSPVTVLNPMPMRAFESKALQRTFDVVYFGTLGGAAVPANPVAGPAPHPLPQPAIEMGGLKIEKAKGSQARSIVEIYAQKQVLKDKSVVVRGKVVKYNASILGRNWIHLRDGSGTDARKDNDITLTTQDTAALGDIITARGIVHLDKDFGAGYKYAAILEEGKVEK
jgi:hypothetical protein